MTELIDLTLTPATHVGTHVDAPYHFHAYGAAVRAVARIL